MVWHCTSAFLG